MHGLARIRQPERKQRALDLLAGRIVTSPKSTGTSAPGLEAFMEGHVHAFGVPTGKVRYDNLKG